MRTKIVPILCGISLGVLILGAQYVFTSSNHTTLPKNNMIPATPALLELQKNIAKAPSHDLYITMGNTYLQLVRESNNATLYQLAEESANNAATLKPNSSEVLSLLASVSLGRHDFKKSLNYIEKAIEINSEVAMYYGIRGDALIELGRYTEAVSAYQTMIDRRPDFNSFNRIAYARELYGDIVGAQEALRHASQAGSSNKKDLAWIETELGRLSLPSNLNTAKNHYNNAEKISPNYAPAQAGLSHVAFFEQDMKKAEAFALSAFELLPTSENATLLGDIFYSLNEPKKAEQYYVLAELAYENSEKLGINIDVEYAQFLIERERRIDEAQPRAARAQEIRPNAIARDNIAWALYQQGKYQEAQKVIADTLDTTKSIGAYNAKILYHSGLIALKNQDNVKAQELLEASIATNQHFSIRDITKRTDALKNL